MAKLSRIYQRIFGSTAPSTDIGKFGSLAAGSPATTNDPDQVQSLSNWLGGWNSAVVGSNSPTIEDMNAVHYVYAYQLAYLMQSGIPEYDSSTTYYIGSFVQSAGIIYQSKTDNNIGNSVSNGTHWTKGISNSTLEAMSDQTIKGNVSGSSATPIDLSAQQVRTMIHIAPTVQKLTSGSGTYTTPANVKYLKVTIVGAGGGGGGSGAGGGSGTDGNSTTFGAATVLGGGGGSGGLYGSGGGGGYVSSTIGTVLVSAAGFAGSNYYNTWAWGGGSLIGSVPKNLTYGSASPANSGAGGNSSFETGGDYSGGGGGGGGALISFIYNPSSTYSYSIGTGGTGGSAGSGGGVGGSGGSGVVIVEEYYL